MRNSVGAVVVGYRDYESCIRCVELIRSQVELVCLVENYSNAHVRSQLKEYCKGNHQIQFIALDANYGIAAALNVGVKCLIENDLKWVVTLDQDSEVNSEFIVEMLNVAASFEVESEVCLFANYNNISVEDSSYKTVYIGITSGNFLNLDLFRNYGFFCEDLFIDSVDFEYFLRLKNSGVFFYQVSKAKLVHKIGDTNLCSSRITSIGQRYVHPPLRRYYIFRNHLYLIKKYWSVNYIYLLRKSAGACALLLSIVLFGPNRVRNLRYIWSGIYDFFRGHYGKYDGLLD